MIGTLTQAYTMLEWNGETLHAYDIGLDDGTKENIAQMVTVDLSRDKAAPTASFSITPNPAGFELFQKLKANALDKPFKVSYGYLNGSVMGPMEFRFAGVQLTTGHDPELQISGTGPVKGAWTDNKLSFTMEEKIPLLEYPEYLKKKCGKGCEPLFFSFVGGAKEKAAQLKVKGNQIQRTPQNILTDVLRPHGMELQVSDNAFSGEMVISFSPAKEGENTEDKPEVNKSGTTAEPGKRKVFIIGPGLMENITRKQDFNVGSTTTQAAASADSPNVPQTNQKAVAEPQNAAPQTDTAESTNVEGGTSGQSNPGSANTGSTAAGKDGQDASAARAKLLSTSCNFTVLMTPYMVGIKPRDFIAIPSLKGPGDYIEDWSVESVKYQQDDVGGASISINGLRPYTGEEPMLDGDTLAEVKSIVKNLKTPAAWNKFYWLQGPEVDRPLSS